MKKILPLSAQHPLIDLMCKIKEEISTINHPGLSANQTLLAYYREHPGVLAEERKAATGRNAEVLTAIHTALVVQKGLLDKAQRLCDAVIEGVSEKIEAILVEYECGISMDHPPHIATTGCSSVLYDPQLLENISEDPTTRSPFNTTELPNMRKLRDHAQSYLTMQKINTLKDTLAEEQFREFKAQFIDTNELRLYAPDFQGLGIKALESIVQKFTQEKVCIPQTATALMKSQLEVYRDEKLPKLQTFFLELLLSKVDSEKAVSLLNKEFVPANVEVSARYFLNIHTQEIHRLISRGKENDIVPLAEKIFQHTYAFPVALHRQVQEKIADLIDHVTDSSKENFIQLIKNAAVKLSQFTDKMDGKAPRELQNYCTRMKELNIECDYETVVRKLKEDPLETLWEKVKIIANTFPGNEHAVNPLLSEMVFRKMHADPNAETTLAALFSNRDREVNIRLLMRLYDGLGPTPTQQLSFVDYCGMMPVGYGKFQTAFLAALKQAIQDNRPMAREMYDWGKAYKKDCWQNLPRTYRILWNFQWEEIALQVPDKFHQIKELFKGEGINEKNILSATRGAVYSAIVRGDNPTALCEKFNALFGREEMKAKDAVKTGYFEALTNIIAAQPHRLVEFLDYKEAAQRIMGIDFQISKKTIESYVATRIETSEGRAQFGSDLKKMPEALAAKCKSAAKKSINSYGDRIDYTKTEKIVFLTEIGILTPQEKEEYLITQFQDLVVYIRPLKFNGYLMGLNEAGGEGALQIYNVASPELKEKLSSALLERLERWRKHTSRENEYRFNLDFRNVLLFIREMNISLSYSEAIRMARHSGLSQEHTFQLLNTTHDSTRHFKSFSDYEFLLRIGADPTVVCTILEANIPAISRENVHVLLDLKIPKKDLEKLLGLALLNYRGNKKDKGDTWENVVRVLVDNRISPEFPNPESEANHDIVQNFKQEVSSYMHEVVKDQMESGKIDVKSLAKFTTYSHCENHITEIAIRLLDDHLQGWGKAKERAPIEATILEYMNAFPTNGKTKKALDEFLFIFFKRRNEAKGWLKKAASEVKHIETPLKQYFHTLEARLSLHQDEASQA